MATDINYKPDRTAEILRLVGGMQGINLPSDPRNSPKFIKQIAAVKKIDEINAKLKGDITKNQDFKLKEQTAAQVSAQNRADALNYKKAAETYEQAMFNQSQSEAKQKYLNDLAEYNMSKLSTSDSPKGKVFVEVGGGYGVWKNPFEPVRASDKLVPVSKVKTSINLPEPKQYVPQTYTSKYGDIPEEPKFDPITFKNTDLMGTDKNDLDYYADNWDVLEKAGSESGYAENLNANETARTQRLDAIKQANTKIAQQAHDIKAAYKSAADRYNQEALKQQDELKVTGEGTAYDKAMMQYQIDLTNYNTKPQNPYAGKGKVFVEVGGGYGVWKNPFESVRASDKLVSVSEKNRYAPATKPVAPVKPTVIYTPFVSDLPEVKPLTPEEIGAYKRKNKKKTKSSEMDMVMNMWNTGKPKASAKNVGNWSPLLTTIPYRSPTFLKSSGLTDKQKQDIIEKDRLADRKTEDLIKSFGRRKIGSFKKKEKKPAAIKKKKQSAKFYGI